MKDTCAPQTIKVGDVVLIHDDSPRARWKMAVIENLIKGNDGNIRAAEVRTNTGKTNRPIARLYPLEITSEQLVDTSTFNKQNDDKQCTDDIDEYSPLMEEQPIRSSALKHVKIYHAGAKRVSALPRRMSRINTIVYRVTVFRVYSNCI